MVDVLSKLGIIDGAVTQAWIRRFYEARGLELTPVEAHISFPLGPATAMEIPPPSEPGETDE